MLIRIRRSRDLLLQFQSFECSSLFASNSCVYCTTRYNKCGRIGTKWLFFFTFIEECCVVIEKNIDRKLANRISYRIWYKRCLKGTFGSQGGSKSAKWGPNPPWHRISLSLHMYGVVNDLATNNHTGQFDGYCVFFKSLKTYGLIQSKTLISVRQELID